MNGPPSYATDARQLEIHLYNPQHNLVQWLKSKGIVPQAYSPLGSTNSPLLSDETASAIASAHGLQIPDVLLGYLGKLKSNNLLLGESLMHHGLSVAKEIVTLPKSVTPARIASNYHGALAAASKLTKEDLEKLDGVAASGKQKRYVMPVMSLPDVSSEPLQLCSASLIMPPWPVDLGFENWPGQNP